MKRKQLNTGVHSTGLALANNCRKLPLSEGFEWNENPPTNFDYELLYRALEYSEGLQVVRIKIDHLLKALDKSVNELACKRVENSFFKWHFLQFHNSGYYTCGDHIRFAVESFLIINAIDPVDNDGFIHFRFDTDFFDVLKGNTTLMILSKERP